ncbi:RNA pseudouridine synthase [Aestuariivirga litoralis]|uniref:Pseudouridine synthase n=1 Tax=Aestuariivirga litoralis TaxID=2650924 RepID=A0A2W2AT86_9HYPH|nr:RluA family pseudouridine synthase [Aestuariivirga litoralis]PZF78525.1 RNA pseudouridine synthase [Aestuariivirga litoralis]
MSVPSQRLETSAAAADRLDKALAAAFPDVSRARFQALIAEGAVSVEGATVTEARHKVKPGDQLRVVLPEAAPALPQAEEMALPIVFEDEDLIVIDKPAGLVVHPGAGNETGTLVNALIAHCGDSLSGIGGVRRPGIVHRLDKDTSGLLVVAKNDRAHHGLSDQFAAHGRDGRLERSYLALVWGVPERRQGTISAAIDRSTANRQKMAVSRSANAREAVTHYEVLEVLGTPPVASLVRCVLETGRTHQIRVHMAHIGHPLLGDGVYGSGFRTSAKKLSDDARNALNALNRQALHATTLGFEHPRTGRQLQFDSPAPEDFAMLLAALRLNNTQA